MIMLLAVTTSAQVTFTTNTSTVERKTGFVGFIGPGDTFESESTYETDGDHIFDYELGCGASATGYYRTYTQAGKLVDSETHYFGTPTVMDDGGNTTGVVDEEWTIPSGFPSPPVDGYATFTVTLVILWWDINEEELAASITVLDFSAL